MTEIEIDALNACANELAYDPKYNEKVNVPDACGLCQFDIKIDDDEWDYQENRISVKTAGIVESLYKDLTDTFNAERASRYSVHDFKQLYKDHLVFNYDKGCLLLSVDVPSFLKIAFQSYAECAHHSRIQWNKVFSGSLYALSTMLQGSRAWYSLEPIFELKKEYKKFPAIMDSLDYAQKLLTFSRNTPDFLVKQLSSNAVVKINREGYINSNGLKSLRYEPTQLDRYYVDDEYKIKSFSTKSIRLTLGTSDKSVSIEALTGKPREKMAELARRAVKDKITTKSSLQIDVFFKGVKYESAKVVGFGDKRDGAIPARELFANPIYSLAVDSVDCAPSKKVKTKSKSKKIVPGQAGLFDSDPSEEE